MYQCNLVSTIAIHYLERNRGSNRSAHVLNLLNELEKRDKCEACNEFDDFNNTGVGMLGFINHDTKTTLKSHYFV